MTEPDIRAAATALREALETLDAKAAEGLLSLAATWVDARLRLTPEPDRALAHRLLAETPSLVVTIQLTTDATGAVDISKPARIEASVPGEDEGDGPRLIAECTNFPPDD